MSIYRLVLIDVRQVQRYLFNANELKQNLGASYLVEQATRRWVQSALDASGLRHNWQDPDADRFDPAATIEQPDVDAEVIFAGGANTAILFKTGGEEDLAQAFTRCYTRMVLQRAPGLEVAVGGVDVNWSQAGGMLAAWNTLQEEEMPRRKEGRTVAQPLLGLGVTAECAYTGKPAVDEIRNGARDVLVSAEAAAKHAYAPRANERLKSALQADPFEYPDDFDSLGGEMSKSRWLAVIHADGNRMGRRIKAYVNKAEDNDDATAGNRDAVERMRRISHAVNLAGMSALEQVRDWLLGACIAWPENHSDQRVEFYDDLGGEQSLQLRENRLPMRPLVYGGDDVTIVCDGRLGLAVAARLLQAFAAQSLVDGGPIYACAGVAIVHTHYPFARAYALAGRLCDYAKQIARQHDHDGSRLALLNWRVVDAGETVESWPDIVRREYQPFFPGLDGRITPGKLALRPLLVEQGAVQTTYPAWRTWDALTGLLRHFRGPTWATRRNKLKDLRQALRGGPAAVSEFVRLHGNLPEVPGLSDEAQAQARRSGWLDDQCLYFDALEIDDLLIVPAQKNLQSQEVA